MSVSESVAVTWNASGKVSYKIMEAELGYSHERTHSVSDSQDISVPSGKRAYVTAWTLYDKTTFDVMDSGIFGDSYVTAGYSYRPMGVRFEIAY